MCQWIYQEEPKSIKATGKLNEDGVDLEMTAELNYGNNKIARIKSNALKTENNTARIVGTKGQITVRLSKHTHGIDNIFNTLDLFERFLLFGHQR